MQTVIRAEQPGDAPIIRQVTEAAFQSAAHSDGTEGAIDTGAVGTYLHGSLLPKNPGIADFLIEKALTRRGHLTYMRQLDDTLELKAQEAAVAAATAARVAAADTSSGEISTSGALTFQGSSSVKRQAIVAKARMTSNSAPLLFLDCIFSPSVMFNTSLAKEAKSLRILVIS